MNELAHRARVEAQHALRNAPQDTHGQPRTIRYEIACERVTQSEPTVTHPPRWTRYARA